MKGQRRRWEDLNEELLVQVFERVDMESLLLDVPFVCQSWHKASLDPKCWKTLIFPDFKPFEGQQNDDVPVERGPEMLLKRFAHENQIDRNRCSITAFIKFVVNHSKGTATVVKLPECCTTEAFQFLADVCPGIVTLALPDSLMFKPDSAKVVGDFKNLEVLSLDALAKFYLDELIGIIDENCEKFWGIDLRKPYCCCLPGPLVEDCEGFVILLPPGCENHHDVEEERIPEFASQSNPRIPELAARVEPLSDGLCTRFLEWVLRELDE